LCTLVATPMAAQITPLTGETTLKWTFSPPISSEAGNDTESPRALLGARRT